MDLDNAHMKFFPRYGTHSTCSRIFCSDVLRFVPQVVSVVSVSLCGQYLAASCRDGIILIWDVNTKQCLVRSVVGLKHWLSNTTISDTMISNDFHSYCKNKMLPFS